jgi:hypothetical protein
VFGSADKEEKRERKDYSLSSGQILEILTKEMKCLNDEKVNLGDIEKKLLFKINEEIIAKIRNNKKLKLEIEKQKMICVELARLLNDSIKYDLANSIPL